MFCDLVTGVAGAAGHAALVGGAGTDTGRAVGFELGALDSLLPLAVAAEIIDVGEDVCWAAVDLDAVDDWGHLRALLTGHRRLHVATTILDRLEVWLIGAGESR